MKTECSLEQRIEDALVRARIRFVRECNDREMTRRLDFFLPDFDIFIEVKRFHSDRIAEQMAHAENVIAVQGQKSTNFLIGLLRRE
jgi:hypothetical protein